ncbi:tRNA (5-methylaminomethyl-2-thiouridine)(34)-methyltransferase MnmD [Roseibium sp. RKSG952]|uniref:tRNA (5-methylaminomethyl-2-thiouridine)(34)-methyltransferase MnmD n=1 Tax=Roseibium sp. RKSG952 TaxID=2529384 RepID=UPI0012BC2AEC|nr:tRNA (5-methylaminomethyl-2-thiouridine)(34)-methyltransferase MnmD [Roseibium sp. RKSG952]MTH98358.1 tRNA 5-methylaminomethyl-2-thiouridine synthase [Roseibium sp. RKSG952]
MKKLDNNNDISNPELTWLEDGVPKAAQFDDTYFSRAGGLSETRHVFLAGNGLPDRWADRQRFTIGEFGFGTGLNFLATLREARRSHPGLRLTYVSFELFPMSAGQLDLALSAFPDLKAEAQELLEHWAPRAGWQTVPLGEATLVLGIGDARDLIAGLETGGGDPRSNAGRPVDPVDAWYLDGFSPAKNPELWDERLLQHAAVLTASDGTCATYTSAGWVRRNLEAAGFEMKKVRGFAGKREMSVGRLKTETV